jgi:hypothetical protein
MLVVNFFRMFPGLIKNRFDHLVHDNRDFPRCEEIAGVQIAPQHGSNVVDWNGITADGIAFVESAVVAGKNVVRFESLNAKPTQILEFGLVNVNLCHGWHPSQLRAWHWFFCARVAHQE